MSEVPVHREYKALKRQPVAAAGPPGKLPPTAPDIEGPFYKAGAPAWVDRHDPESFTVGGVVFGTDGKHVAGAVLDVWQADPGGNYDAEGYAYRGTVKADRGGNYRFSTVRPGHYKISEKEFRCPHVHVKVTAPGFKELTTQLYFADDEYDATDHWFNRDNCLRPLNPHGDRTGFDFVLEPEAAPEPPRMGGEEDADAPSPPRPDERDPNSPDRPVRYD
jgi:protocatechuate 3,4-dioxygenase beta subunit